MDTSQVTSGTIELLSRITGQKLSQRDITPRVLFLGSLVTVLMGVMFVNGTVEEEKQRLLKILYRFSFPDNAVRQLMHLMIKGVKENQTYKKTQDLLNLTSPLSESEKILLMGFGYEMSALNGNIDMREKQYLQMVAKNLGIKSQHLAVLEMGLTQEVNIDENSLNEVLLLLHASRFQELDTTFVKAASAMLTAFSSKTGIKATQKHTTVSYEELKKFQIYRQDLNKYCNLVLQIIDECKEHGFLPPTLIDEITEVYNKIKNQKFRLAVIGEFSQGKSTLLNALLGEEIQPAREIPCSGTVTILKYGSSKRVICRYKNGKEEEIPLQDYHLKATISEEAAIECLNNEIVHSEIEEIIFEHPNLDLCTNGVEILDSPGLNENCNRNIITQKILQDIDAAIFLTNVSRSLTQGERELLQDLKTKLNYGKNEPAHNLFIVANFMDLVRTEKGREQVKQRIERFVSGEHPIVVGENRVHFISAQAALDAMLQGIENEYLQSFQNFTHSLQRFLTLEIGKLKSHQSVEQINRVIQKTLNFLSQFEQTLENEIQISEAQKLEILEKIGEASGRDIRIRILVHNVIDEVYEIASQSYDEWHEELGERMAEKTVDWHSEHNVVLSQDKLIKDYTNLFIRDLLQEIDAWENKILKDIIKKGVEYLDNSISYELDAIQADFQLLDQQIKTNFSQQINLSIGGINDDFIGFGGIGGGLGVGGVLAAGLLAFTGLGFIAIVVGAVIAAIAGSFGFGLLDVDGLYDKIKLKVIEIGCEKFNNEESIDKVSEKLDEIINTLFVSRIEGSSRVIEEAISLYETLLEQQERAYQETLEEREIKKAFINQKRQELEQVQKELQTIINKSIPSVITNLNPLQN
jgi:GTPase Era involved in 16S rRNA processing/uncharacterized tellurite resistance protein B-like protein